MAMWSPNPRACRWCRCCQSFVVAWMLLGNTESALENALSKGCFRASVQECLRSEVAKLRQPLQSILPSSSLECLLLNVSRYAASNRIWCLYHGRVLGFTRSQVSLCFFFHPLDFLLLNRISTYIHPVSNMCRTQLMYHALILNFFDQENGADKPWWKRSA